MTQEQFKELLRSQQGELNAVLMYQRLAKVVKTDKEREAFLQLEEMFGKAEQLKTTATLRKQPSSTQHICIRDNIH